MDALKILNEIISQINYLELEKSKNGLLKMRNTAQDLVNTLDNELLNYTEPKFKVGDYVVEEGSEYLSGKVISLIEEITEDEKLLGSFYIPETNKFVNFLETCDSVIDKDARYATPEEISEYKAALNFHEHGRNPFEIKDGDIVEVNGEKLFITYAETSQKKSYIKDGWKLVMTVEEFEKLSS